MVSTARCRRRSAGQPSSPSATPMLQERNSSKPPTATGRASVSATARARHSASGSPCSGVAMARSASPSHCSSASAGKHRAGPLGCARAAVAYGGSEWQAGMGEAVEADGQHGEPRLGPGEPDAGAGGRCRAQPACRRERRRARGPRQGRAPSRKGTAGKAMADKVVERPRLETWRNPDGGGDTWLRGLVHCRFPPCRAAAGAAGARGAPDHTAPALFHHEGWPDGGGGMTGS